MEEPTYKGSEMKAGEGRGEREREGPPGYYGSPGSRGARIVTGQPPSHRASHVAVASTLCAYLRHTVKIDWT